MLTVTGEHNIMARGGSRKECGYAVWLGSAATYKDREACRVCLEIIGGSVRGLDVLKSAAEKKISVSFYRFLLDLYE